jgi:nucleoside-diphosphate-sugar epimerase
MNSTERTLAGRKILVTGGAGLVGQNLLQRLGTRGYQRLVAIDKHPVNTTTLTRLQPRVQVIHADLARSGDWGAALAGTDVLIINHAQIGGLEEKHFIDNNLLATANVLAAAQTHRVPQLIHISSSVVNSRARDFYTESKKAQERLVIDSGIPACILRPTLMFGWFDRKHLGWLARFMSRAPVFPVPGDGRYQRQPLFVRDFCDIIISCIETPQPGKIFNISGREQIAYVDLIRDLKHATAARARVICIPFGLFRMLLRLYALVDHNPPFTTAQLEALVIPEVFEVIDWPRIFGVAATPLADALRVTFQDPVYSSVKLEF